MSAPVDVLAVIRSRANRFDRNGVAVVDETLLEAAAAVAELIEAATRANGEHSAPHDCYATGPLTGDPHRDLVSCPGCELAAALARVTGAQS